MNIEVLNYYWSFDDVYFKILIDEKEAFVGCDYIADDNQFELQEYEVNELGGKGKIVIEEINEHMKFFLLVEN